jgi:hypothetical protein
VALAGRLYARQAWAALGQVIASPQLLPSTELQSGVLRSMFCAPPDGAARPLGAPMAAAHSGAASPRLRAPGTPHSRSGLPQQSPRAAAAAAQETPATPCAGADAGRAGSPTAAAAARALLAGAAGGAQQSRVKVGDRIFLGTRQRLRGTIRYVGPVHWDGEDWVGAAA